MKSMYERMLNQELYIGGSDPVVREKFIRGKKLAQAYNRLEFDQFEERAMLLKQLFGKTGERIYMEAPIYVDYGIHTTIGENFYANFGCTLLDVARIRIGDNVMFGPHVNLITAGHPIDALTRIAGPELGKEITIGDNVWLGANVTVNPGVTIGQNSVIGSGAVVTRDIPENVVAVGNPCRVLRIISEEEKQYWREQHRQLLVELNEADEAQPPYPFSQFKEWIATGREIEFCYNGLRYSVTYYSDERSRYISFKEFYKEPVEFETAESFMNNARIDGVLLSEIWDAVSDVDIF